MATTCCRIVTGTSDIKDHRGYTCCGDLYLEIKVLEEFQWRQLAHDPTICCHDRTIQQLQNIRILKQHLTCGLVTAPFTIIMDFVTNLHNQTSQSHQLEHTVLVGSHHTLQQENTKLG